MEDNNLEAIAACGSRLKDLLQNTPGWKDAQAIIDAMRKEAFVEWTTLPLDASTEKVIAIRAKETVLGAFIAKIEEAIKAGDEAGEQLQDRKTNLEEEAATSLQLGATSSAEIDALLKPLTNEHTI